MKATDEQLRERWLTPEGEKVKQEVAEHIQENNWERFLVGFPFVDEVENGKDLRFIDLSNKNIKEEECPIAVSTSTGFEEFYPTEPYFGQANLQEANLIGANLKKINFEKANLMNANFGRANLQEANLEAVWLKKAILIEANLEGTILVRARLDGAKLNNAILKNSCLNEANLSGTNLTSAVIYGISAWDTITDKDTIMKNLIISEDPLITVDDIEIAQFMYMIINNEKISILINSMRTKGVLILGSFYDDKTSENTPKKVLNKIKKEILKKGLIPIVFDFKPSIHLDLTSTVKTFALLSSFIIVDLSNPAGQLIEIGELVREFPIPIIPIASEKTEHITGMISKATYGNYNWVRTDVVYYNLDNFDKQFPGIVKFEIIQWAENKNKELEKQRESKAPN